MIKNTYNNEVGQRIFRLPQILGMYGLSKATVYRQIKEGKFPKPVKLSGNRAVGWRKEDLMAWENSLGIYKKEAEMTRLQDSFLETICSANLNPGQIVPDGCFHRFDIQKKGDKAGGHILSLEPPYGTFGNWRTGEQTTWKPDSYEQFSEQEKIEHGRKIEEQKKAAEKAKKRLDAAEPTSTTNPYLRSKRITQPDSLKDLRQSGESLFVPVLDRKGNDSNIRIPSTARDEISPMYFDISTRFQFPLTLKKCMNIIPYTGMAV